MKRTQVRTVTLGGVKVSPAEMAKYKHSWRKERVGKETFSAWVRRRLS